MLRKTLIGIGILLLLVIASAIAIPFLFKDKILAKVKSEINNHVNATVNFKDFDLTIIRSFPNLTASLEELSVVGLADFKEDTLLSMKNFEATVDIMSVINGEQIRIKQISLESPRIHAIVLKDGKANWDIAKPSADTSKTAPEKPSAFKLALKKLAITKGDIIYDDAKMNVYTHIQNLNHELSGDFTQDNFVLATLTNIDAFTVSYGGVKYLNDVKTSLKADLEMDMKNSKYTFKENELQLNELILGFDGFVAMAKDMQMDLKFNAKKTDFKNFISLIPAVYTKDFANIQTSGKLGFDGYAKGTMNEQSKPAFGLNLSIEKGMFKYPSLPTSVNNVLVDLKVNNPDGNLDHTIVNLKQMHVELGKEPFDAKLLLQTPISDAQIDAMVKGQVNLDNIKQIVPLPAGTSLSGIINCDLTAQGRMSQIEKKQYEQFHAAGQLAVSNLKYSSNELPKGVDVSSLQMTFNPKNVTLNTLNAKMGKSDFNMNGTLDNFIAYALKGDVLKGSLNFNSTLLDVNELMASQPQNTATTPDKKDTTPMSIVAVPANIDFTLAAKIGKMLYDKLELSNLSGQVIVKDQTIQMNQLAVNMLQGKMLVSGTYSTKQPRKALINFDLAMNSFDIPNTFNSFNTVQSIAPIGKNCTGNFSTKFKLNGELNQKMEPVLPSLNAEGGLNLAQVVVQNFEPLKKLASELKIDKYKQFNIDKLALNFKLRDGRLYIDPYNLNLGNTKVNVTGSNGIDQTLNYVMAFDIPRSEFGGAANSVINGLVSAANAKGAQFSVGDRVNVDALIGGTMTKPTVKLAMKGSSGKSLVDDMKAKAEEELNKKKAELEAKAKAEADRLKKEAEDKAKEEMDKAKQAADKAKKDAEDKIKSEVDKAKQDAKDKAKEGFNNLFKKPK